MTFSYGERFKQERERLIEAANFPYEVEIKLAQRQTAAKAVKSWQKEPIH